ncbi:unnamed protein product [Leptosia nina]|uniref:Doublesex dimerisation domain-containing protein n=1 Tax=Leptosia nina TaxID=320188 RepID=A0AAV1JS38_9NEOP
MNDAITPVSLEEGAVSLEPLVENCHKLLEIFHYSWEMMPLVLVILNYAGNDLEEASRKIDEGKPSNSTSVTMATAMVLTELSSA